MTDDHQKQTTASVVRNVVYGAMTWVLPVGLNLAAVPVIVGSLGHSDYGIYALVLGFVAYSYTFNFGRAITKYIAEYRVSGESEKIADVVSASLFLCVIVGFLGSVIMCLLARWLVSDVFMIEPEAQNRSVTAIYIASGIIFFTMISQIFNAVLQGVQRFDVYSKIFTANSFGLIVGNLLLAYFNFGLLSLLIWNFALLVVFCVIYAFAAKRLLPGFGIRFSIDPSIRRLVIRYSAAIVVFQFLGNILLLFERGLITQRLGVESLTYYVIPMSLGIFMHGFISSLVLVVFPLASELSDDREKLLRLYLKATKIISVVVVFIVMSLIVQSDVFLRLWMGDDFARESSNLLVLHIICFGLISIMSISSQMTEGLGHPWYNAALAGIYSFIGVTLMVLLVGGLGNQGAAIARLITFGTIFFSVFIVERWFFSKVQTRFWFRLIGILSAASLAAWVIEYAIMSSLPEQWPTLALSVFLGGISYCLVLWILDFITADEKLLVRRVFSRLG